MKNIKAFEDFGTQKISEGENHHKNYMFFQHLMTIKDAIEDLLNMDREEVDAILNNGHDWANDHISTSVDDIEEVYHFLKNRMNMEDGEEHGHDDDDHDDRDEEETEILKMVTVDDVEMSKELGAEEAEEDDDDDDDE